MIDETFISAIDINLARQFELSPDARLILRDGAKATLVTLTQSDQGWTVETDDDGAVTLLMLDTVLSDDDLAKVSDFIYYKSALRADIYGNGTKVPWRLESDRVVRMKGYKAAQKYVAVVVGITTEAGTSLTTEAGATLELEAA